MKRQYFPTTTTFTLLWLAAILAPIVTLPPISGDENDQYTKCGVLFNCGSLTGIDYPFSSRDRPEECGHPGLKLACENNTATILINNLKYRVLDLDQKAQILKIARSDLSQNPCTEELKNTTLDWGLFEYASSYMNLTFLYGCPSLGVMVPYQFDCPVKGIAERSGYVELGVGAPLSGFCHVSIVVPVSYPSLVNFTDLVQLEELVAKGFEVRYKVDSGACRECRNSRGRCGWDVTGKRFACFCSDQSAAESKTCAATVVGAAGSYSSRAPTATVAPSASARIVRWKLTKLRKP
ncbi:hypothetical protein CDL12_27586 [Handroanthus impetiginosus]|uniref:non-specific serine/threonine protein kinase n=1 Tax=Handroanthus impetiginosus TaxID=429701 RepID=A0A2G9G3L5_9LAMI|nr:hypothetical protein CDL12_27586 [Handroanthus impetiginosus]